MKALKGKKSPGVDQLVAEAYQHLEAPELDGLAGGVTQVLRTGQPPVEWGGKMRPLYKKGGSPQAGELETKMMCHHGGQACPDGDLREDTPAAVCGGGHIGQHVGVCAG